MAAVKDYYELLGVGRDAGPDDLKKAYRRLARKYHPDLNPGDKASEEKFKEINEAYAVLGDPKKKGDYDRFGKSPFEEGGPWFEQAPPFEDIFGFGFGDLFGDMLRGQETAGRRGADILTSLEVSLEEAFSGVTKKIAITREASCKECSGVGAKETKTCDKCRGSGNVHISKGFFRMSQPCPSCKGTGKKVLKPCRLCEGRGKDILTETINVKIPAGMDNGSLVKLRGMGNAGHAQGPAGDLHIKISVRPHPIFERKGNDIYLKLPVTFGETALGAKIEVPTIDGTLAMNLPAGTQSGQRLMLKAKGMTSPRGGRGHMYVDVEIKVPEYLSEKARDALKEIEASYKENPRKAMIKKIRQ